MKKVVLSLVVAVFGSNVNASEDFLIKIENKINSPVHFVAKGAKNPNNYELKDSLGWVTKDTYHKLYADDPWFEEIGVTPGSFVTFAFYDGLGSFKECVQDMQAIGFASFTLTGGANFSDPNTVCEVNYSDKDYVEHTWLYFSFKNSSLDEREKYRVGAYDMIAQRWKALSIPLGGYQSMSASIEASEINQALDAERPVQFSLMEPLGNKIHLCGLPSAFNGNYAFRFKDDACSLINLAKAQDYLLDYSFHNRNSGLQETKRYHLAAFDDTSSAWKTISHALDAGAGMKSTHDITKINPDIEPDHPLRFALIETDGKNIFYCAENKLAATGSYDFELINNSCVVNNRR